MSAEKNYTKYSLWVTLLVIIMMLGLSFIPPFTVGDLRFKRTNILSELLTIGNDSTAGKELDESADRLFIEEMERREAEQREAEKISLDSVASATAAPSREQSWELASNIGVGATVADTRVEPAVMNGESVTPIEDYWDSTGVSIRDFCRLLGSATREGTVRIAFLGDSYIEGDIITADVREQLQALYGGEGVGFVPFSSPLATNRPTVKHSFSGWKNYNLAQKKSAPEELTDKFFVSGILSVPVGGQPWVEYEATGYRKHIARSQAARVIFESGGKSTVKLTVNDTLERTFTPESGDMVQQIRVAGTPIKKLRVDLSDTAAFVGYGVSFESDRGVVVDNYSIRSNSGLALFGTSANVNGQIGRMLGYDLIVLQYGLNAMDPEVLNYAGYGQNMRRMVNYIKRCFPGAAVLLLGVGDRSTMVDGELRTMPAVKAMIREQRGIAKDCGIAFWDVFMAMGGENSMADFVEKGWAAKDYTHLSFGGGRHIAKQLVNALLYLKQSADADDAGDEVPGVHDRQAANDFLVGEGEPAGINDLSEIHDGGSPGTDSVAMQEAPSVISDTAARELMPPVPDTAVILPASEGWTEGADDPEYHAPADSSEREDAGIERGSGDE